MASSFNAANRNLNPAAATHDAKGFHPISGGQSSSAEATSGKPAANPGVQARDENGAMSAQKQNATPALASGPAFRQAGAVLTPLPAAARPDMLVNILGDNPQPMLVMQSLQCLWLPTVDIIMFPRGAEEFFGMIMDTRRKLGELPLAANLIEQAMKKFMEDLRAELERKLPPECQKAYQEALQESKSCNDALSASVLMNTRLGGMILQYSKKLAASS
jgi:hypothetical protein